MNDYTPTPAPALDSAEECASASCGIQKTPTPPPPEPEGDASLGRDALERVEPGGDEVREVLDEAALVGSAADAPADAGADGALAASTSVTPSLELPELLGWASVAGLGLETTTGGGDAPHVVVNSAAELVELAESSEPLSIAISGALEVGELHLSSNKTLLGISSDAVLRGGLSIRGTADRFIQNVIIKNLQIDARSSGIEGDGIQIHAAHHIWIDHCEIRDSADGLVDIVHGSDFVTLSYNRFLYTGNAPGNAERFAHVIGSGVGNELEDRDHLNVTWHDNWWAGGVARAITGRFGKIHLFNNLFESAGNQSVLIAGAEASFLVEQNHFENVAAPHDLLREAQINLVATGNRYVATSGAERTSGAPFLPPYAYRLRAAEDVKAFVMSEAGPQ